MNAPSKLAAEAAEWAASRTKGPKGRAHFVIEPDGRLWRLSVHPKKGKPTIITGLTRGECNRRRLEFSDAGYVGKVVA